MAEITKHEISEKVEQFMQSLDKLSEKAASQHDWRRENSIDKEVENKLYDFLEQNELI